ncbi:GyrI-like domain-containing protein [Fulvivirga aurantia]|uniref:GyrI-like domain-containing protein n=1 Tax=Fulvivirga aurantia TaxID=2529383 RepID=UPI0012BD2602|nr:GyrI-like domain-containing protein [Fulvivirga aurantia]
MKKSKIQLIGLQLEGRTTNENGQSSIDCGNLWQRFEKEHILGKVPNKKSDSIYAVYFDYEGDHTKPFSYFIGCEVESGTSTPEGLNTLVIPEQLYKKVTAKGQMPGCITEAWHIIWTSTIDRAYSYDFELYDKRSHDWNNAEVDIFIAEK